MTTRLAANGIVVTRGGRRVLDGATLALGAGEIATLEGPSGCGKTTMLRVLASLTEPDEGEVSLDGVDARTMAPRAYRTRVAYVPQQPPMLDGSVEDNVATGPRLRGERASAAVIGALLARVGLSGFEARVAGELSGGERQRVALARALANTPEVLLLDEPTSALDPAAAAHVLALVRELAAEALSVLVVTHVDAQAKALGGRRHHIVEGRVREGAAP